MRGSHVLEICPPLDGTPPVIADSPGVPPTPSVDVVVQGYDTLDPVAELVSDHYERLLLAASWGQFGGVVFDRVVQQGRADDIGVLDLVVGDDPGGDPQ